MRTTIEAVKYWIEIRLPVANETEEAITNFLFESGARGCYSEGDVLRAYFQDTDWNQTKQDRLQQYLQQLAELHLPVQPGLLQVEKIADRDWNALWKQSLAPIEIGDKILIKPGWITIAPDPNKVVIEIDPQMAFGTGVHETTRLMLHLMQKYLATAEHILDMGTGTGILAIAAARLSGAEIFAFDISPTAAATARQNCEKNHVINRIHIFCGTLDVIKNRTFDLLLANLDRTILTESLARIFRFLNRDGRAIFSGLLASEEKMFLNTLKNHQLRVVERQQLGEWIGLVVTRPL